MSDAQHKVASCVVGLVVFVLVAIPVQAAEDSLYALHCTSCHGAEGQGATGIPDLADNVWQYGGSLEEIERSIMQGRQSVMPAFGMALGDEGLAQIVAYVLSFNAPVDTDPDELAAGEVMFVVYCASCHGEQGTGTLALGAPDLTDAVWLHGDRAVTTETMIGDVVSNGRSNEMPEYGDRLSAAEIRELAIYVQNFRE